MHTSNHTTQSTQHARLGGAPLLILVFIIAAVATALVTIVLVTMFERKQEAQTPFVRVTEVTELTTDPRPWGDNWPHQFDGYVQTAGDRFYGGSSAMPESKLDQQPWLKRLYAGYAFSIDYREARGHAYMLYDQGVTERITQKPQAGACLHCHASTTVMYKRIGLEAMGEPADEAALADGLNMPAIQRGFEEVSRMPYAEVLKLLKATPDGTPDDDTTLFDQPPAGGFTGEFAGAPVEDPHDFAGTAHPVSCLDCHDPKTMQLRITRPGFMQGIRDLAASDAPVPHLPSIEKWRRIADADKDPYDPNELATRQEMRSFSCAQCHVEYYCATSDVLSFPWAEGLRAEDLEKVWENTTFPDGTPFKDYTHKETGARVFKVQHPEFELWSQGVHAQAGVSCADCHMPYERVGAMKVSNHNVQSPIHNINNACQQCHNDDEENLIARIENIQQKTVDLTNRAGAAMTDMLDAIREAQAAGATAEQMAPILELQRKAMWRLDFISSENSKGFHADQEAARLLAESIDMSRQAQAMALRIRSAGDVQTPPLPENPITGVTEDK